MHEANDRVRMYYNLHSTVLTPLPHEFNMSYMELLAVVD